MLGVAPRACDLLCPMGDFWDTLLQCLFGARMSLQSISKICRSVLRKQSEACAFQPIAHIYFEHHQTSIPIPSAIIAILLPSFLRIFLNTSLVQRWRLRHALGTHKLLGKQKGGSLSLDSGMSPIVDNSGHIFIQGHSCTKTTLSYGSVSKPCTPGEHQNSW